ncbi:HPr kinase/phosphorylase [Pseudooceanicola aestuarii]|uniref:HPr kinase/phosphorylase n=1 Tax=Pseudooceanicola aestuarii TaxID=2697319 RepID=UPI0013D0CFBE|nr:HPr kinase/phosphatase C-terminal domain-containing protein [Pseudooceanicola aestuarii]
MGAHPVPPGPARPALCLHGSCVAADGRGLLIRGASGRGKSALALELIGLGADLVADDRTDLTCDGARIIASAPAALRGLVEARGLGLLRADHRPAAPLVAILDLDAEEPERLPPHRTTDLLGVTLPLIRGYHNGGMRIPAPAILQYLRKGRAA